MGNNKTFTITFTKLNGESVTRKGKWTDKCKEHIANAGHACLTYLDLDADGYRTATGKWSIKWFTIYYCTLEYSL